MTEPLEVGMTPQLDYRYAIGKFGSLFLEGLRDGLIRAGRCSHCGLVQTPPRVVCSRCLKTIEDIVEVGPGATVLAYTVVTFPFLDPFTGEPRPLPYAYGMVRFHGADNTFQYFLEETRLTHLRIGLEVQAVFAEERQGLLTDLKPFRTV